jgi:hypothetical protein
MRVLSPDELQELRADIATIGISDERRDELIHLVDAIAISFVDQAFGLNSVQLSLSARANQAFANFAFNDTKPCAILPKSETLELVDLVAFDRREGAINTKNPKRDRAP